MKGVEFEIPVISIGNLTAGGTGKSPHTEYLIRLLKNQNQVATLSRGYGRSVSGFKIVTTDSTVRDCGDEPLQFKSKFPNIVVAVDKDRVNGIIELVKHKAELNCILLDDAYQHRGIIPSHSILLTEYNKPFFKDWMLPTGDLREYPIGKNRADTIIVTKCPSELTVEDQSDFRIRMNLKPNQAVYFSKFKYGVIRSINGNLEHNSLSELKGKNIVLVTGIANPKPLTEQLNKDKINFEHLKFPDHHPFNEKDIVKIRNLFDTFDDEKLILTTEKDAQRLKSIESISALPFYYLQIEVAFLNEEQSFKTEIEEHVRNYKSNR
jgi:tetraacyldisaccharide 4'-kinase